MAPVPLSEDELPSGSEETRGGIFHPCRHRRSRSGASAKAAAGGERQGEGTEKGPDPQERRESSDRGGGWFRPKPLDTVTEEGRGELP
jgi:hypothetical protein